MWKGRTFQLFFIWLVALEFILSWENIKIKITREQKTKAFAYGLVLLLPTLFVVSEYYLGLNGAIANLSAQNSVAFSGSMPLAIEYLVFSLLFCLTVFLSFGKKGLTGFALPALFVGLVGFLYTIDNVFPYGQFTPFQLLVPTTASFAAGVLGLMGYTVVSGTEFGTGMPTLASDGFIRNSKVCDRMALRRYRESAYLHGCGFAVFEEDEHFLESKNWASLPSAQQSHTSLMF